MDGAKVKGGADIRFAIKDDNPGKTAAAGGGVNGKNHGITLLDFVGGIVLVAGLAGFAILLFADVPEGWGIVLFAGSLLLALGGGMLCRHTRRFNEAVYQARLHRRYAQSEIAQATRELSDEKRASRERFADAENRHNMQLAEVKAAAEKESADLHKEIAVRKEEVATKHKQLKEVERILELNNQKLSAELVDVHKDLAYYYNRSQVGIYGDNYACFYYDGLLSAHKRNCSGIYVIYNATNGWVKIGHTDNFSLRFPKIKTSLNFAGINKKGIYPLALVPLDEGRYETEQEIHADSKLAKHRKDGEWFDVPPADAIAVVAKHVFLRQMENFKERAKYIPFQSGFKDVPSVRFGIDWATIAPDEVEKIPLYLLFSNERKGFVRDADGRSPVHLAALYNKNPQVISTLAARIEEPKEPYDSPIMEAVNADNTAVIGALIEAGYPIDIFHVAENARSADMAYATGSRAGICWLDKDEYGLTPLARAVMENNIAAAKGFCKCNSVLLGAYTMSKNGKRESALHYAVRNSATREMVKTLIDCGVDVNCLNTQGKTPLDLAVGSSEYLADELQKAGGRKTG